MYAIVIYVYHSLRDFLTRCRRPNSQIRMLHESPNFKLLSKPPDMRINSNDASHYTLQSYLSAKYPQEANAKLVHSFYFVHRLDYATSGIICIPMTKRACKLISAVFQSRRAEKYYLAVVRGILSQDVIVVQEAIGEDRSTPDAISAQKMCIARDARCARARPAATVVTRLEDGFYENFPGTKVLIRPITGRRHQIRVHCASLGHAIVGDYTYSNKTDVKPRRMFLHSLRLVLPNDLESVDLQTEDPFVEAATLGKWTTHNAYQTMDEAYDLLGRYAKSVPIV